MVAVRGYRFNRLLDAYNAYIKLILPARASRRSLRQPACASLVRPCPPPAPPSAALPPEWQRPPLSTPCPAGVGGVLPSGHKARGERAGGFPGSAGGLPTLEQSSVSVLPYLRAIRRAYALSCRRFQEGAATPHGGGLSG
eukprot:446994-Prorocentrum_minimum.AAC.1